MNKYQLEKDRKFEEERTNVYKLLVGQLKPSDEEIVTEQGRKGKELYMKSCLIGVHIE